MSPHEIIKEWQVFCIDGAEKNSKVKFTAKMPAHARPVDALNEFLKIEQVQTPAIYVVVTDGLLYRFKVEEPPKHQYEVTFI